MTGTKPTTDRYHEVARIFQEERFGSAELLEGWGGESLDELRELLTPAEYRTLVERLRERADDKRR
jgi:hypothetical protein